ncbi:hypothetical protein JCM16358_25050 [Halanaerocella petrolearia]
MAEKGFSITEAFNFGWDILKKNFSLFFFSTFLWFIMFALGLAFNFKSQVIFNLVRILLTFGIINLILKLYDRQEVNIKDIILDFDTTIKLFMFLLGFIVLLGVVVIPLWIVKMALGLNPQLLLTISLVLVVGTLAYLNAKFLFASYLMLDKELELFAAFKKSFYLTRGVEIKLLAFLFLVVALIMVSFSHLFLLPVIFVTYPTSIGACVSVYRQLIESE